MSTNKTQNYALHAWEPTDDFLRQEFNENFAKLDAGAVRMLCGDYQGSVAIQVETPQRIEVGVKPRAVFLTTHNSTLPYGGGNYAYTGLATAEYPLKTALVLDESGFTVRNVGSLKLNENTINYRYVILY